MKRKLVRVGIVVVVIAVLGAAAAWLFLDVNRYRGVIQTQLEHQLQRKVTLGKLTLGLIPLRLQVKDPVIADDPSFSTKEPFVRAASLDVRVSLMSLLGGNVQVQSLELHRPSVELVRNRQGVWNFSTIGPKPELGKAGGSGSGSAAAVALDRVLITDGQIAITDHQFNQPRAVYDHIGFELRDYKAGQPFNLDLSAHLPGDGAEEIRLSGTGGPIPDSGPAATPFKGKLTIREVGIDGLKQFLGSAALKNAAGSISGETDIASQSGDLTAAGKLALTGLKFNGVDVGYPINVDYDLASKVATGVLSVRKANLQLGATPLAIAGSINTSATPPALDLTVKSGDTSIAEIARLLSAFGVAFAPGTNVAGKVAVDVRAKGSASNPALTGSVKGRDIEISGKDVPMPVQVKAVNIALSPTEIRSDDFTATSGKTAINARFAVQQYTSSNPMVSANVRAPNATLPELQAIAKAYGVNGLDQIEGQGGLNLDMRLAGSAQSLSGPEVMKAVNGVINLDFSPLKIKGFDVVKELATIGKFSAPGGGGALTDLVKVTGAIAVKDGIAQTSDLKAQLLVGSLAAVGSTNLVNDALNMKISAVFNKGFADSVGGSKVGGILNTVLANPSGELVIPAIVTGTTKQPKFSPDLAAVAELQKQRLLPTLADPKSGLGGLLSAFTNSKPAAQPAPAGDATTPGQPAPAAAAAEQPKPAERLTGLLGGLLGGKKNATNPLMGTSWQWEKVSAPNGRTESAKSPDKFVLAFAADGKVSSSTDCNRLTGSYTADDSKLSIGALAGTRMACGESQESVYSTALAAAASYAISGDTLSIRLRDQSVMTFKRAR